MKMEIIEEIENLQLSIEKNDLLSKEEIPTFEIGGPLPLICRIL